MSHLGPPSLPALSVVAQFLGQGRLANLGAHFRRGGGQADWTMVLLVITALAAAIGMVWLISRHLSLKESGGYHNHRSLFRELCRAHRLHRRDRRLLVLVARKQGVVVPARLFVEPERFDPAGLSGLRETDRRRAAELAAALFGEHAGDGQ